jgi:hypothetical protein
MSFAARQARRKVMELIEAHATRFRSDDELWPLRVPREPLRLDELVRNALGDDATRFDPLSLRSRTLLHLEWDDESTWDLWVAMLPTGLKVFCDSGADEARVLASGGRHSSDATDRLFLSHLGESGGERFGIEMSGGAPAVVRSPFAGSDVLIEFFLHLFEVTGAEVSVLHQLSEAGVSHGGAADGTDFRDAVASWLDLTASKV